MPEEYKKLKDIPSDILAGRVIHTLTMAKGNINQWEKIIEELIVKVRKEYDDEEADAQREVIRKATCEACSHYRVCPVCTAAKMDEGLGADGDNGRIFHVESYKGKGTFGGGGGGGAPLSPEERAKREEMLKKECKRIAREHGHYWLHSCDANVEAKCGDCGQLKSEADDVCPSGVQQS